MRQDDLEVVGVEAVEDALSRQYQGAMRLLPTDPGASRMQLHSLLPPR